MFKRPSLIISLLALLVALGGAGLAANGGPFLLGNANTATEQTSLASSVAGRTLRLQNLNTVAGATALALIVAEGRPPMVVNSNERVPNLNADLVDGRHANELLRAGRATNQDSFAIVVFTTQASITLEVPRPGFVLLNAQAFAQTDSAACNPCYHHLVLVDDETNTFSPSMTVSAGDGDTATHDAGTSLTWLFPVTKGTRTFSVRSGKTPFNADIATKNAAMTALYVPFGPEGTLALSGGTPQTGLSKVEKLGPPARDGNGSVLR